MHVLDGRLLSVLSFYLHSTTSYFSAFFSFFFVSHVIFVVIVVVAVVFSFFWQMTWHIWATLFPLLDGIFFCVVALRLFLFHIRFFLFMWSEVFTVFSNNSSVFYVFGYFSFFRWHFVISQLAVLMTFPLNQRDEIKNDWWNGKDPSHHPKSKRLSRTWAHLIFDLRKKVENHSFFCVHVRT